MIRIQNLRKQFKSHDPRKAFSLHIEELDIQDGEIVYFLGPNGSGKTVLLALIQGVLDADAGSVTIDNNGENKSVDLMDLEAYERAKYLGVVPQDSDEALVNEMTIADHVLVGLSPSGKIPLFFPRLRFRSPVGDILGQFDLGFENRLNEFVGNLSGGERQVLTFCIATVMRPAIMLLDEFTSALDPEMTRKVLETVMVFLRSNKLTALIVTHRHKEAIENADRIIVLHKGKPYCEIKKGDSHFNEDRLKKIFNALYIPDNSGAIE
jgi:putative tryptophan/tyrosine transport system ATP-binding protein